MAYKKRIRPAALGLGLFASGAVADLAVRHAMWGLFAGALLAALWLGAVNWWAAKRPRSAPQAIATTTPPGFGADRLLLDAAPTPMLAVEGERVRVLNRAARRLFATDDRVVPAPPGILDRSIDRLRYEARQWRIDRVTLPDERCTVVALIDVEQEERVAEARASSEMIHVLGHELLNGLAPIASLAESGEALIEATVLDRDMLRDVMGTLARRTEGLQRFTEGYRSLARLPEPRCQRVAMVELASDLERLFAGRWPGTPLTVQCRASADPSIDRDQIMQAVWALLQNAAQAVSAGGGVSLTIDADDQMMTIDVSDDGMGVPPGEVTRIFRPFYTTRNEGTGVGLSLARQVAHAHGGTLTLEASSRTTFRLRTP